MWKILKSVRPISPTHKNTCLQLTAAKRPRKLKTFCQSPLPENMKALSDDRMPPFSNPSTALGPFQYRIQLGPCMLPPQAPHPQAARPPDKPGTLQECRSAPLHRPIPITMPDHHSTTTNMSCRLSVCRSILVDLSAWPCPGRKRRSARQP